MNKTSAIEKINILIKRLDSLPPYNFRGDNSDFDKWYRDTEIAIENIFGNQSRHINDFKDVSFSLSYFSFSDPDTVFIQAHHRGRSKAKTVLLSFIDEINEYWQETVDDLHSVTIDYHRTIITILQNFHRAARQLLVRYSDRQSIEINDEYDVQDLLHVFLKLHFDDIRAEEYTPSYAGGSSRIDFLIDDQKIAIEVKKTRSTLKDKELGEQLLIDIMRYQSHPKVKSLICFVYDPEGKIKNPKGLETDLMNTNTGIKVTAIICPKF